MEHLIPILFAGAVGFGHAFEADHLVAVSSIVSRRNSFWLAIKDGMYWGLGHTSTIFLIGVLIISFRMTFLSGYLGYLEGGVGIMLLILGLYRLYQLWQYIYHLYQHEYGLNHTHSHPLLMDHSDHHHLAYGVGLVHGLAGSGAMVLLVMTEIRDAIPSLAYLLIFGLGSVAGMLVASGLFSLPFSRALVQSWRLQVGLTLLSSVLCLAFGGLIVREHLFS